MPDFKEDERKLITWYKNELSKLNVNIHMNTFVDRSMIENLKPDEIVLATGAKERILSIPGTDSKNMVTACEVLMDDSLVGNDVTIVGAGLVGCEVALWLNEKGKKVTIVECMDGPMESVYISYANKQMLLDMLELKNIPIKLGTSLQSMEDGQAVLIRKDFCKEAVKTDTIVLAVGYCSDTDLYRQIFDLPIRKHVIGDAREVQNIQYAIWDGYEIARTI